MNQCNQEKTMSQYDQINKMNQCDQVTRMNQFNLTNQESKSRSNHLDWICFF